MKMSARLVAVAFLLLGWGAASAQRTMTVDQLRRASKQTQYKNPYSTKSKAQRENTSIGTFFAEYNPHTWNFDSNNYSEKTTGYHGVSVGFSYFVPVVGDFGFDAGLKGQYLFRNKKENGVTNKFEMFSATVPVDLVYDWKVSYSLAIDPYAGVYGRYNFMAKSKQEAGGGRTTTDWFDKSQVPSTMKRFQIGWQVGVNFRISDMVTIGGAYWADLSKIKEHTKLHGFNLMVGANF